MRTISFTFASFCRITALAVLSFSLAGCGLMDYGGGGAGTRGTKTYTVRGKTYRPYLSADGYREDGVASWYGRDFHGKTTANGERYNMYAMTAAHKLLPLGTKVRVTHLRNGKSIVVRVNDRGPFVGDRIIDLSYASAKELGMIGTGTARVRVEAIETFGGASPGDMNGSFYIQIAALSSQASAQELVRRLQNRNLGGRAFYAPSLGLWRVQVAPQTDDDEDTEKDDFRHGMLNDHRNLRRRAPSGREEERTSCFTPCCVWSPEKTKKTLRQHVP